MTNSDLKNILAQAINDKLSANTEDVWRQAGIFSPIKQLSPDNVGEVGEMFVANMLEMLEHEVEVNNETDATNKHWDVLVDGRVGLEVKTATIGKNGRMFQHERLEKNKQYAAVVLVDISPDSIYLTVAPKETLPFTVANNNWTVNKKRMHRRADSSNYKWDLSLSDVEGRKIETLDQVKEMFAPLLHEE